MGRVPGQVPPGPGTPPDWVPPQDQVHLPDQVHPLGPGTPPGTRYTPTGPGTPQRDQVHPHRTRYTPLRTRYTHSGARYTPPVLFMWGVPGQVPPPQDQHGFIIIQHTCDILLPNCSKNEILCPLFGHYQKMIQKAIGKLFSFIHFIFYVAI